MMQIRNHCVVLLFVFGSFVDEYDKREARKGQNEDEN